MSELVLHHLSGSPNSARVRLALGYKGLDHEVREIDPGDRSGLVALSRQPFAPVLQHGETVVFDSLAILRYLEANFPDAPPLYSGDYGTMRAIETWELEARALLSEPIGMVFGQAQRAAPDPEILMRANELLQQRTEKFEERLAEGRFLVGDQLTAADVANAPYLHLGIFEGSDDDGPITRVFARHFRLGNGRDAVRRWASEVMGYA